MNCHRKSSKFTLNFIGISLTLRSNYKFQWHVTSTSPKLHQHLSKIPPDSAVQPPTKEQKGKCLPPPGEPQETAIGSRGSSHKTSLKPKRKLGSFQTPSTHRVQFQSLPLKKSHPQAPRNHGTGKPKILDAPNTRHMYAGKYTKTHKIRK